MTRTKITTIILIISLVVLCLASLTAKPLITGQHKESVLETMRDISESSLGKKMITHYSLLLRSLIERKLGIFKNVDVNNSIQVAFILAGFMLAGAAALFVSLVSLALFIINSPKKIPQPPSGRDVFIILLLVILNGTVIRLLLASVCYGNFDMESFHHVAEIVAKGGNVYAETSRYNYSPAWFMVLGVLNRIHTQLPAIPLFVLIKSFTSVIDLITLMVLLFICQHEKLSMIKASIFFYLNPVSFLISGYHGQFENWAILMVLIGILAYLKLRHKAPLAAALLWIFATAGLIIKHNIFYELIICLNCAIKRYWLKILLFVVSVCAFLVLFIPYWATGSKGIIDNVFRYSSGVGWYGIVSMFYLPELKYVFIAAMFIFPLFLKGPDIITQCLLGMIFFLAFTTGIAAQYLILPVALGALRPSKGFMLYSLAASVFVLGYTPNVYLPVFYLFRNWNIVWLGVMYWFYMEFRNARKTGQIALPWQSYSYSGPERGDGNN